MSNYKLRGIMSIMLALYLVLSAVPVAAHGAAVPQDNYLSIATIEDRPLSNDRLLHVAFKDIGYQATFNPMLLQTGYEVVNTGELDGVVVFTPNIEEYYSDLRKVDVPLEDIEVCVFVREGSSFSPKQWSDLAGYTVGLNTQRPYIRSRLPKNTEIIEKDTAALVMDELVNGNCDAVVLSIRAHETYVAPSGVIMTGILENLYDYLYMSKKHENLIPSIEESIRAMNSDGRADRILNDLPAAEHPDKRTVLHIVSSNLEVSREEDFSATLKKSLEDDMSIEWYTMSLNSRRFNNDANRLSYFAGLLRQDCLSKEVAAVIVSGDDALQLAAGYYNLFFRNVPVFFYGASENYPEIIQGNERFFTGIEEKLSVRETVDAALALFPDTKNIYVVNDSTTDGINYREDMKKQLGQYEDKLNIQYNENLTCSDLLSVISELPQDSLVLIGSYSVDANGMYYPLYEMKRLLELNCSVPILSMHSTELEYNTIGGKCLNYTKFGEIIADMLRRVLNDEDPAGISVVSDSELYSDWVFSKPMLDRFGIRENQLPEGSAVLGKKPSIWESDPRYAVALVLLIIAGIGVSILMIRYNKQKELLAKDKKIREVKDRLERIINTAPVAFIMTVDGIVVESNQYVNKNLGLYDGDSSSKIYTSPSQENALLDNSLKDEIVENQILKFGIQDGETHRFLANISFAEYEDKPAHILWAMDIEENERKSDQLRAARKSLQDIMDHLPIPVSIIDNQNSVIIYANNACLKLFCCDTPSGIVGRHASEVMPVLQLNGINSRYKISELLMSDEPLTMEVEYTTSEGSLIESLVRTCNIEYYGKNSTLLIITDLAAEKAQKRMLLNAAEKEKEANQLKSRFLVNMSHEIRTPMNAIIGLTEIELLKDLDEKTRDVYTKISAAAKNLLEIINDILDLSKIEADKIELFEDEFELEEVLNNALLVASPRLDGKNVEFMLNASMDLPKFVVGDRTRLWQILKNFLDNSAKYTEKGKIVLTAFLDAEHSDSETASITFIIEDTGIGISEDQMNRLFMPYEQIRNDAQKRYSGTGLGMAISKQLCEIMGGSLQVESRIGKGTTISVSIPFKRSDNSNQALTEQLGLLSGLEVLAVDDDRLSLEIMEKLLTNSNINCTLATSGYEAMDIIIKRRDMGKTFDVILLDYLMEGMNGLETARQIHLALSNAPKLLMVTAYQKLLLKSELEKCGIEDIIEKPFIPSRFIAKLCSTLGLETKKADKESEITQYKDVHVLLCEDYPINQEVALGMFEQFGITATVAENGKVGVDILQSGKSFDMIFMDLQMPVMDGFQATRVIRGDHRFDDIPIISLTADAMKEVVDQCFEAGMNDHVAKPVEFSGLQRVFTRWLPESKRVAGQPDQK